MINYSENIGGTWVQIASDGDDYMLQNKSKSNKLLVKTSVSLPAGSDGSFELGPGEVIASTILNGNIFVRALSDNVLIAYAK